MALLPLYPGQALLSLTLRTLTSLASKFGPVFSLKMGSVDCVVVADKAMH